MPIAKSRSHFQFGGWAKFSMPPISAIFHSHFPAALRRSFCLKCIAVGIVSRVGCTCRKKAAKVGVFFLFLPLYKKKQNPNLILNSSELELNEWKTRTLPKRFFNAMHFADYYCSLLFFFFIFFYLFFFLLTGLRDAAVINLT